MPAELVLIVKLVCRRALSQDVVRQAFQDRLIMNKNVSWINEISNFLEEYSGVYPEHPDTDIFKDMAVAGDDFHEMIEEYAKQYKVDMSDYLWYFHADEEGHNSIGGQLFKPPYERVRRIPVTPQMLADFIVTKKWMVDYPAHKIPKHRTDLTINKVIVISFLVGLGIWLLRKI